MHDIYDGAKQCQQSLGVLDHDRCTHTMMTSWISQETEQVYTYMYVHDVTAAN